MTNDAYDLARFADAQGDSYDRALAEIASGRKRSHWMFHRLLDKYFGGEPDDATLRLIAATAASSARRDR